MTIPSPKQQKEKMDIGEFILVTPLSAMVDVGRGILSSGPKTRRFAPKKLKRGIRKH